MNKQKLLFGDNLVNYYWVKDTKKTERMSTNEPAMVVARSADSGNAWVDRLHNSRLRGD